MPYRLTRAAVLSAGVVAASELDSNKKQSNSRNFNSVNGAASHSHRSAQLLISNIYI